MKPARKAKPTIRDVAAARVLNDPAVTDGARRLSASIKALGDESEPAMERLEALAQRSRRV